MSSVDCDIRTLSPISHSTSPASDIFLSPEEDTRDFFSDPLDLITLDNLSSEIDHSLPTLSYPQVNLKSSRLLPSSTALHLHDTHLQYPPIIELPIEDNPSPHVILLNLKELLETCSIRDTVRLPGIVPLLEFVVSLVSVLFLSEFEDILSAQPNDEILKTKRPNTNRRVVSEFFQRISEAICSNNFLVAEKALSLFGNDSIVDLLKATSFVTIPKLILPLAQNTRQHWHPTVKTLSLSVLKLLQETDNDTYTYNLKLLDTLAGSRHKHFMSHEKVKQISLQCHFQAELMVQMVESTHDPDWTTNKAVFNEIFSKSRLPAKTKKLLRSTNSILSPLSIPIGNEQMEHQIVSPTVSPVLGISPLTISSHYATPPLLSPLDDDDTLSTQPASKQVQSIVKDAQRVLIRRKSSLGHHRPHPVIFPSTDVNQEYNTNTPRQLNSPTDLSDPLSFLVGANSFSPNDSDGDFDVLFDPLDTFRFSSSNSADSPNSPSASLPELKISFEPDLPTPLSVFNLSLPPSNLETPKSRNRPNQIENETYLKVEEGRLTPPTPIIPSHAFIPPSASVEIDNSLPNTMQKSPLRFNQKMTQLPAVRVSGVRETHSETQSVKTRPKQSQTPLPTQNTLKRNSTQSSVILPSVRRSVDSRASLNVSEFINESSSPSPFVRRTPNPPPTAHRRALSSLSLQPTPNHKTHQRRLSLKVLPNATKRREEITAAVSDSQNGMIRRSSTHLSGIAKTSPKSSPQTNHRSLPLPTPVPRANVQFALITPFISNKFSQTLASPETDQKIIPSASHFVTKYITKFFPNVFAKQAIQPDSTIVTVQPIQEYLSHQTRIAVMLK
ncbi:putative Protein phosphatase 2A regulatory B subunit (B56 family) [Blattamonas nauphoetae]|uniref:Uncharacterized protein n=1 Tax=Blattamonas nauphoetae TaxID=2049346 RepID=A0ABQ9WWZ8_9EUKA|nr:putative Protein phosphatase 2A regulatory B subunit (B56 family) [Blattamonas nauphoetae]